VVRERAGDGADEPDGRADVVVGGERAEFVEVRHAAPQQGHEALPLALGVGPEDGGGRHLTVGRGDEPRERFEHGLGERASSGFSSWR
jgi:hypothetical protein